jgi:hypothetical protein
MTFQIRRHALRSVSFFFALVAPLLSCSSSDELLRVGDETITDADVRFARSSKVCYGDTSSTKESLVAKLVSDLMEHEVLRSAFNNTPPDSILHAKAEVIQQTTRDSVVLGCILSIGDMPRYHRFVVRPTLVNGRLRARYSSDSAIHASARDTIQQIFDRLREDPANFLHQKLDTLRIPRASELDHDPFVENVVSKLELGSLWPQIVETDTDYRIVMLHGRSDSLYQVLAIRTMKQTFDTWFREYVKQRVPITVADKSLEATMRKRYPTLWWLQ